MIQVGRELIEVAFAFEGKPLHHPLDARTY